MSTQREPLWPRSLKIPVLGVTGPYASGKTLFLLTIDPKNTLLFDTEKSAASYEALGFNRVDLANEVQKQYPNGASAQQAYEVWLKLIRAVPAGKYSVIGVDPIDDLENGLIDHTLANYSKYNFNSREAFDKAGGIKWAAIKNTWKSTLQEIASKCEVFGFTSHLRRVWVGGAPTEEVQPRGKTTLMELASLYLMLDRPDGNGLPSATVLKSRLAVPVMDEETGLTVTQVLPPRMPVATVRALRDYIVNPAGLRELLPEELAPEKGVGRDVRSATEEARRKAAERAAGGPPVTEDEACAMRDLAEQAGIQDKVLAGTAMILGARGSAPASDADLVALAQALTRAEYDTLLGKIRAKLEPAA